MRNLVVCIVGCLGAGVTAAGFLACSIQSNGMAVVADASVADVADAGVVPDVMDVMVEVTTEATPDVQDEPEPTCTEESCGGACCGGRCVPRNCGGCDAGSIFCPFQAGLAGVNGYCVSACSSCDAGGTTADVTCFSCAGAAPAGRCALSPSECPAALDAGACSCASGEAVECPGATQACTMGLACRTCGQPSTNGQPCANGKGCSEQNATCNQ